jgi:dTMP kinase
MFITFEGPEGCGKSTQIEKLQQWYQTQGVAACAVREPGGTYAGEKIRSILKDSAAGLTALSELYLFLAARAQICESVIAPALANEQVVICDRFIDSTVVYQGGMRNLGREFCKEQNNVVTKGLVPDVTFMLMVPLETIKQRVIARGHGDRFDMMGLTAHQHIIDEYWRLAKEYPERIITLDGTKPRDELHQEILSQIHARQSAK